MTRTSRGDDSIPQEWASSSLAQKKGVHMFDPHTGKRPVTDPWGFIPWAKHSARRLKLHELLIVVVALLYSLPAHALKPGDIMVTDNESNHVVRVDPDTGLQTEFADRGDVALCSVLLSSFSPQGVAVDSSMRVYAVNVADVPLPVPPEVPLPAPSEVIRFNLDGSCDSVASGIDLADSDGVAIERAGTLLVTTSRCVSCAASSPPALIRVNPNTGDQVVLSFGRFFTDPEQIAVDPVDGSIYVSDDGNFTTIPASIVRVNPVSGVQTRVSAGGFFFNLSGLVVETPGLLLATERGDKLAGGLSHQTKVIRINLGIPFPGFNQSRVDSPFAFPVTPRPEYDGIAVDENGELILGLQFDNLGASIGAVTQMQPITGLQSVITISTGPPLGVLEGVDGVAIVPEPGAGLTQLAVLAVLATLARRASQKPASGRTRHRC